MSGPAQTHPTLATQPGAATPAPEETPMSTYPEPTGVATATAVAYIRVSTKDPVSYTHLTLPTNREV